MRTIRLYILKEIFPPFLLSLLISTIILTTGNIIQMADLIINKGVSPLEMCKLIAYLMPSLLTFTVPISILSAILLAFARLTSDNEIIALRASGISLFRISLPVLTTGLIISLLAIPLNYTIMPEAGYRARKLLKEIGVKNPTALLEPGVFLKIFKDYIVFIYDMEGPILKNVRIYQPMEKGPTRTLIAEKGEIVSSPEEKSLKIKLTNGIADESDPNNPGGLYKLVFKNYYITLSLKESLRSQKVAKKPRELTINELREEIENHKERSIDATILLIEFYNKAALAFSNLIFVLIAIPIGVKTHRREKSINFGMALLVFLIYWTLMLGAVSCSMEKMVPPWLGAWAPNIIFGFISLFLFTRVIKR